MTLARCAARAMFLTLLLTTTLASFLDAAEKEDQKVRDAKSVYQELLSSPDREVPQTLLRDCRCIAVIPRVIKGAFGYGARYGQGVITCRNAGGAWSPLAFLKLTGGSLGFQIGAQATDVVLFFMTEHGARSLLQSKFTLGGTASVAAGPAGRTAEASTDVKLDAEIYSYAKSKGLFAGIALEGARLAPDPKAIQSYYGEAVSPEAILFEHKAPKFPESARAFLAVLPAAPVNVPDGPKR
jgi:lipid-binding SYLF domain-containing protein